MGLNILRAELTKLSVVGKQKRCMMNTSMLEGVLSAGFIAMAKTRHSCGRPGLFIVLMLLLLTAVHLAEHGQKQKSGTLI